MSYEVEVKRYFTIPLKRTSEIELVKTLETFIQNTYNKSTEELNKHILNFNNLRSDAVIKPLDKSVNSLHVLFQYHDQLVATSRRVPFKQEYGVHVFFTWKDSLQKGSFLSNTPKLSISDGDFERLCVLFNIGALMSQVGNESNLQTDGGLKTAAKYFQESAGIFAYIKDNIISVTGRNSPTSDMSPQILNAFRIVMIAQAQECFYYKANGDPSFQEKLDMLAKIAMQASYLYDESAKAFREAEGNNSLSPVLAQCNAKKEFFECRAQCHQAKAVVEMKRFGEGIARYRIVESIVNALLKIPTDVLPDVSMKQLHAIVTSEKETLEKDNYFIYNDVIPKASQLNPIAKAPIAKAKPFNPEDTLSPNFIDMFASLLPLAIHNALESFEGRRKGLVESQLERLREQNTLVNGVMSSLNLPAALEDMFGHDFPVSILQKSRTVIAKGGFEPIEQSLQELPSALGRNQDILTESVRILNVEQSEDAELREKFGSKWQRKPSAELTASLRQEANKYQTIIENARNADNVIKKKYVENREGISLLCLPIHELKNAIPSAGPIAALQDHRVVHELKMLCEQVETLKAEREVIENELRTTRCDMTDKFTQILREYGTLHEEFISPGELDRVYQPLIRRINDSIDRQESLLVNLQRVSDEFALLKHTSVDVSSREKTFKKMAAAYDRYQELWAHVQEGGQFYSNLTVLMLKLQGKCSDLVFARKTEKEDLLSEIQQNNISTQSFNSAYHQPHMSGQAGNVAVPEMETRYPGSAPSERFPAYPGYPPQPDGAPYPGYTLAYLGHLSQPSYSGYPQPPQNFWGQYPPH